MSDLDTILPSVFFLRGQADEDRREVAAIAVSHNYKKGNVLFFDGDPSTMLYIVVSGKVKITLMNEEGREIVLSLVRPGGVCGLIAALDNGFHVGTAVTVADSRLAAIPVARFQEWLRSRPRLHEAVLLEMAKMVRSAYGKVGEQALLPVKQRLLMALVEIAREEGRQGHGDEIVFLRPTHQDLAERIGTTRVVVSRALKELLEEEGVITAEGRVLRVRLSRVELAEM